MLKLIRIGDLYYEIIEEKLDGGEIWCKVNVYSVDLELNRARKLRSEWTVKEDLVGAEVVLVNPVIDRGF